jgi:hypothetical protein
MKGLFPVLRLQNLVAVQSQVRGESVQRIRIVVDGGNTAVRRRRLGAN